MSEDADPVPVYVDAGAPTLAFDGAGPMWQINGLFSIVLTVGRPTAMSDRTVPIIPHVVCQLQSNREGLIGIKRAIDDLLLASAEPHGKAQ